MKRDRFEHLDALRAFSVMLVLWTHGSGINIGIDGYHGVLLFFVISGFLITEILLDSRRTAELHFVPRRTVLSAFYVRRFLRIFPVYYAVLMIAFVLASADVRGPLSWHLAYLSNWYFASTGRFDATTAHLWSLAVEEQFYLVWPWLALLFPRALLPWSITLMIVVGPSSRLLLGYAGANSLATWITTPTVLDALGLGCLLAYLWRQSSLADKAARWAAVLGMLVFGLRFVMLHAGLPEYVVFAITPLGWALLWTWVVHRAARGFSGWLGRIASARAVVYVGTISYGIYLLHLFLIPIASRIQMRVAALIHVPVAVPLQQFVTVTIVSIAAATVSWVLWERPINDLKRFFPYVRLTRRERESPER